MPEVVASVSFFVNAGIRFVEETCKMRAFTAMWDRITAERYGVTDPKARRFRYGVQVNSLGLTEAQPENNVQRIVLEALGVTLSRDARARSLQLPAWNEALGLPRPWDQQWSLRIQQVLAFETDLLEYDDLFDGSHVIEAKTAELDRVRPQAELDDVLALGGAFEAIDELKGRLVRSHTERMRRIESGDQQVVGVNAFTETRRSPLGGEDNILKVDPAVQDEMIADVARVARRPRHRRGASAALDELARVAGTDENIMPATIALAKAGGTTGEWAGGCARCSASTAAPTGVAAAAGASRRIRRPRAPSPTGCGPLPGGPPRLLVAKPGLDGHSNGAEQIAVAARDAGMEVIYQGIRLTPEQIAAAARDEDVDVIGLSILSGSHLELVPEVVRLLRAEGVDAPVVAGGIILPRTDPPDRAGRRRVYTPKDFELTRIMADIVDLAVAHRS